MITWLMFLADGENDLLAAAESSGELFDELFQAASQLVDSGLLEWVSG